MTSMHTKTDFHQRLEYNHQEIEASPIDIVQINLGKLCNLACRHCHVDASPRQKRDNMNKETADQVLKLIQNSSTKIQTVDLTGGAPELNPYFRFLVKELSQIPQLTIIDRCNLTVLFEPNQEDLVDFLQAHKVKLIASLPCYQDKNVDFQRGNGVFDQSIKALNLLNQAGYGIPNSGLELDLIFNPTGPTIPPDQKSLKELYKQKLFEDFEIVFNELYCLTNMPIKRFRYDLRRSNQLEAYEQLLQEHFNPRSAEQVMCKNLLSIDFRGKLYNCDFNQALNMELPNDIWNISNLSELNERSIQFDNHCFGCTAGAGSSCQGATL